MENKIIIYATDVCPRIQDAGKAKLAVMVAAKELGIKCDCRLSQSWQIWIDKSDRDAFLQLAKEMVNEIHIN